MNEPLQEAIAYSDGFAKVVHAFQSDKLNPVRNDPQDLSPPSDPGLSLGWDDEQIAVWMDRQTRVPAGDGAPMALMGIAGYCVDVAGPTGDTWVSLNRVRGALSLGDRDFGVFEDEQPVQPTPNRLDAGTMDYWLPSYFARWDGGNLGAVSAFSASMRGIDPVGLGPIRPVSDEPFPLRYGQTYRFRVRAMDLAGGGPSSNDQPLDPGPAPFAQTTFRRFTPPRPPRVEVVPAPASGPPVGLRLSRPPLG